MRSLTIGDVARRVGIRASAIRYYESLGLLPEPPRDGGWRTFDPATISRLQVIRAARDFGFALDEIRQLLDGFAPDTPPPERWRTLAREKLPEVEAGIRRAVALKRLLEAGMRCQCVRIEDCFLDDCSAPAPALAGPATTRSARTLPVLDS
jgi:MerR family transcriptional regulator, redox-sensitive transcriptional activator SoxR